MDVLSFEWAERSIVSPNSQSKRTFLDILINGQSLRLKTKQDWVSPLCKEWAPEVVGTAIQALATGVGRPQLKGRIEILVCAECGDIGCGALTCVINRGEQVIWSDFAYEVDWYVDSPEECIDRQRYPNLGQFTFDSAQYQDALKTAKALLGL